MRLFVGIEFGKNVLEALFSLQNEIRKLVRSGRYPLRENLHLTMQFLGETPESKVRDLVQALEEIAGKNQPFSLSFEQKLGYFGKNNPVRVVWLGIKDELPALRSLQTSIVLETGHLGYTNDGKQYIPHITLARDADFINPGCLLKNGLIDFAIEAFPISRVERFSLFSSSVEQGKLVYRILNSFSLNTD